MSSGKKALVGGAVTAGVEYWLQEDYRDGMHALKLGAVAAASTLGTEVVMNKVSGTANRPGLQAIAAGMVYAGAVQYLEMPTYADSFFMNTLMHVGINYGTDMLLNRGGGSRVQNMLANSGL